eukprot:CAMPEP_0117003682 /NCGR_PEP_ID=MMETSP0472-20121206/4919_1 /TAXON_ID=693140 ORGANISM="Tiarina fusus, Strain LIS" /NCGR_SAMPLE_ID=MMETSP0472 /ASSEMBLY_ACC=CAM_ASM_000603 /LENGTH=357 /DNA_ID=CAMNT_0004704409 /DNA_START=63 /DNA_END=1137 /DNA_ORIENTATION=-
MTIDLYPEVVYDVTPDIGGEIDEAVEKIREATKGWGTNEGALLRAMAYRTPEERCKVAIKYKETHGKELKAVMKSECGSRDFGTALQLLALPPDLAEVDIIRKACRGLGTDELLLYPVICGRSNKEIDQLKKKYFEVSATDELLLYPVLCGRSNKEIDQLKKKYFEVYSKDLGGVLDAELGGTFEKLIFHCLQGLEEDVDSDYHTDDLVDQDVDTFYAMGEGKFGTDEAGLFKLLCSRPSEHLAAVNLKYAEKHDVTLFKVMDSELGGDTREATLFLLGMKLKPYETVAKLIKEACKGAGTNELLLSCTIIRYHLVLKDVMLAYVELYGDTLQELIKSEVGGDYKRLLVEMCDAAMS